MIINFSVKNFKSIKDEITLSFEATRLKDLEEYYVIEPIKGLRLLKLGLIYGPNASGKTNILKAINFLRKIVLKPFENKTTKFNYKPFLFDNESKYNNTFFIIEFINNGIKYNYTIEFNESSIVKENLYFFNPNKALFYSRKTDINNKITQISFGSKIKLKKEEKKALIANTLWNNSVLGGYLKTNIKLDEFENVINWFQYYLKEPLFPEENIESEIETTLEDFLFKKSIKEIINEKIENDDSFKNVLLKLLKKADFAISDINIKTYDLANDEQFLNKLRNIKIEYKNKLKNILKLKEIYFKHNVSNSNNGYWLPFDEESRGTQRFYNIIGLLAIALMENNIIMIDEIEASLHPDLIKHFILIFLANSKKSQLIATTHNRELLMEKDILRFDTIWFTDKLENCSTDLYSLSHFNTSKVRKSNSIYNLYKIGKLGAIPDLHDYYLDI